MFDDLSESLGERDEATRLQLLQLLIERGKYNEAQGELNELRIAALVDPSPERDQAIADFAATTLPPIREALHDRMGAVLKSSVDVGALKNLLPAILAGALEAVDLRALFLVLGIEPATIESLIGRIRDYINLGMDTQE